MHVEIMTVEEEVPLPKAGTLDVGIRSVDAQHQELFALLGQLEALHRAGQDKQALDEALPQLQNYALFHFSEEEELMGSLVGCSDFVQLHREQHQAFIRQINLLLESRDQEHHAALVAQLGGYLRRWLVNHIGSSDRDLAQKLLAQAPSLRNR